MYKEMRRKDRQLPEDEIQHILNTADYGVLSTVSEDGTPYGIPLNYAYKENKIYFHCAAAGHKLDNIKENPQISFCITSDVEVVSNKFTTKYKSVILFGTAKEADDEDKLDILKLLIEKYSSAHIESGMKYIKEGAKHTSIYEIEISHITGKGNR